MDRPKRPNKYVAISLSDCGFYLDFHTIIILMVRQRRPGEIWKAVRRSRRRARPARTITACAR